MSPAKGHGRQEAHRRAAQAAAREAARRQQRRIRMMVVAGVVLVVVLATVLVSIGSGGDDVDDRAATTSTTTPSTTAPVETEEPVAIPDEPVESAPAFEYGTGACAPERKPDTRPASFDAPFASCLKPDAEYKAVIGTSEGAFTIDLLPKRAPGTVNNFVQLARSGWFDGDDFHRIVPGFVIQGGDPVGTGEGGPGYQIADELPASVEEYTLGAVAMANSGPNTNGSQWFVCIDCLTQLRTPDYSLFGWVSDGFDVVRAINAKQGGEVQIVAVEILEDILSEDG